MKTRQVARWIVVAVCAFGTQLTEAQPGGEYGGGFEGGMPPFGDEGFLRSQAGRPDNREAARRMTDEMQHSLTLTAKQYKKIYKLNLHWLDSRSESAAGDDPRTAFVSGPEGSGSEEGPVFPEDDKRSETASALTGSRLNALREPSEEEVAQRHAKLKKVLTVEQFDQWRKMGAGPRDLREQSGDRFRKP